MYLIVLILPLLSSLISGFFGRWLGYYGVSILSTSCIGIAFLTSILIFFEIGFTNTQVFIDINTWFEIGILKINWGFLFDSITAIMLVVVLSISTLVHLYSIEYMSTDPHVPRFMSFLSIFTFFMLTLVTSNNILQMFLGWEGVGLASYLLINFWFTRLLANKAALKALIVNRIGDFGLTLAILLIIYCFKSVQYSTIFSLLPFLAYSHLQLFNIQITYVTIIGIFLFVGAVGKSAQLGLHTWLPDAMEGPTPVSALIHAATMVTAGVFLLIRFSPLLEYSNTILLLLTISGSVTAFFASLVGTFQNDLKKVIAYSTCSQLGYMILSCGLSCYNVSMFHLTNHAFFKALLFLSAGSIIHALSDEQDMRRMGSLVTFLPLTYSLMLIGSLALCGFPFLTGFYSKDVILEITNIYRNKNIFLYIGVLACWLGNLSVIFTAYYSFRLLYLTFFNNCNFYRPQLFQLKEPSIFMLTPLLSLSVCSIYFGYYFKDIFIGPGSLFWNISILILPINFNFLESEFIFIYLKWIPFLLSFLGVFIATLLNLYNYNFQNYIKALNFLYFFINKKWYFDIIYNKIIVFPLLNFGYTITFKNLDRGFIELAGPYGVNIFVNKFSLILSRLQTGQISHYILFIIVSVGLLLFILMCKLNLLLLSFYFVLIFFI
nr:NADH dehydrogenase subunit 5 [Pleonosporium sp.]